MGISRFVDPRGRHGWVVTLVPCLLAAACGTGQASPPGGTSSASSTPSLPAAPSFAQHGLQTIPLGDWAVIAAADLNRDGKPDVVTTSSSSIGVLLGNGDGTFEAAFQIEVPDADYVSVVDLNGDNRGDIVAAGEQLAVLLGIGDGTFAKAVRYEAGSHSANVELNLFGLDVADLDGDGVSDLVAANWGASRLAVLPGKGDGTFGPAALTECSSCVQVAAGDFDRDGDLDIATTSFSPGSDSIGDLLVFLNDGHGQLALHDAYADAGAHAITLGDVNGDGILDAMTANDGFHAVALFLGRGDGAFEAGVTYPAGNTHAVEVVDLDGNGRLDVVSGSVDGPRIGFLQGVENGELRQTQGIDTGYGAGGLAVVDLDGDGKLDVVISQSGTLNQVVGAFLQQ